MSLWPSPDTPGAIFASPKMGALTLNGIVMVGPHFTIAGQPYAAWQILDVKPLWQPSSVRGADRVLPRAAGVKPYPRVRTVTAHSLPMVITGYFDRTGAVQANPYEGLEANIDYLRAQVTDPPGTADGTIAAVLTMPSGATKTGSLHVTDMPLGTQTGAIVLATLDVSLPDGVLS